METSSLKKKTIKGISWSMVDIFANQGFQFLIQIILARLLLPQDFGVIGMITVFIAISNIVIDSGLSNALIREKEVTQEEYSTIFYSNLVLAVVTYIVILFSANPISVFFKEPQLIPLLRVLAIVLIINSFGLVQRTMLVKKVEFKLQTRISIISNLFSGILSISSACFGFGIWSLVIRVMSLQFMQSFLLCLYNKWMPSFVFKIDSFKKFFSFGWKLLISGLIDTLYQNLYYVIIGRLFSAVELGYYTNAQKLRDVASTSITTSVQKVSYPVLCSIQDESELLRAGYRKIIRSSVFVTFPIMIGLAVIANPLFNILFRENWISSIPYFQILCLAGMFYPLHAINLNILQVKGRSDLFLSLEIIKKAIGVASIVIVLVLNLGIMGLLWAAVINSIIAYFINSYFSAELVNYSTIEQIKDILPILINASVMGVIVYFLQIIFPNSNMIKLAAQIIAGIIIYSGLSRLAKLEEFNDVSNLIRSIFIKNKI
ncbi:capsular polysaccharide repeat unit transporter [Dehalobacter sp. DCA]|jgi:Membrane protein involved in the export of O-antigen and teichoic acid|uniref:lipopolysaccharide biosynthesis protein n=1 Tax=Dehalobacter sp. DCA TaxID=1147129 RepID=UPI00028AF2AE|nr:lipopolysaccharide biosynthesis protein [Dehalobacter sp. DCA]AFV02094.1 capsular polysaccharide repeat unit transporter [Dehalobacter sp. DCA]